MGVLAKEDVEAWIWGPLSNSRYESTQNKEILVEAESEGKR